VVGAMAFILVGLQVDANAGADNAESRRFSRTHITKAQWHAFFSETGGKRGAITVDRAELTYIVVPTEAAGYFFTTPAHPAHPAVVRRSIVVNRNRTFVHTIGYYAGSRAAFAEWMNLFLAEDRRLQRGLKDRGVSATFLLVRILSRAALHSQ